jgi:lantibiotic modifying enzyme
MKMEEKRKNFWKGFIANVADEIKQKFSQGPKPFSQTENIIVTNILSSLVSFLDVYLLPVIVDYIAQQKQYKADKAISTSIYDSLFSKNYAEIIETLETNYSEVMIKIYNRIRLFTTHYMQACDRIFSDWEEIKLKFNVTDDDKIYDIRFFCGDIHGTAGGQTTIITFNNEEKGFVYKPVDLSIVEFFHSAFNFTQEKCGLSFRNIPSIISKRSVGSADYGYINFISYQGQLKSLSEARKVYENYGRILAFARFFKISDGHCDNMLIQSPDVFWIDLENSFHFVSAELASSDIHPLEVTGLITETKPKSTVFGIITGIQGGTLIRLNLTQPIAYNDGTDEIYIRYFGMTDVAKQDKKNRVYLDGKICMPEEYAEDIKVGYTETITALLAAKKDILAFIDSYFKANEVIVRHIFKATASYSRYINMINHVVAIKKGNSLSQIRIELNELTQESEPFKRFIIENEVIDMCNGVIPYFYRSSLNNALYHASGCSINDFFKDDIFVDFTKHLESLNENVVEPDLEFIERALKSTAGITTWDDFKGKFGYPEFDYDNSLKAASEA